LNFEAVKSSFGDLSAEIIAKFSAMAQDKMVAALNKEGKYPFKMGGRELELTKAQVIFTREVGPDFIDNSFRFGYVLLDKTRTAELDREGYAREIMRRVQSARKKAGLEKIDRILLYIQVDEDLKKWLEPWKEKIQLKVGASKMRIAVEESVKKHKFVSEEKVKEKKFFLYFDKE
jgi:isoleucyl-tRNA synthetase